jgi:O-antigen/teichoic acid export membrane protein
MHHKSIFHSGKGEYLTKSEIRVQYSGFIIFAARMISIATGLAFILMLTRSTTEPELGTWGNVNDIIAYFAFLSPAFPFWAMRFEARNKEGTIKTGFIANLLISLLATIIYIPTIPLIMSLLGISKNYMIIYLIASMQIIETYLISMLEACLRAKKPQTIAYGLLIEEGCKVLSAYVLLYSPYNLHQPLVGVFLSLIAGFLVQIIYYLKLFSKELKQPIQLSYVKEWLKGSTINIYYYVGDRIAALVFIMLIAYNPLVGPQARGIYQAAMTIASIIMYSNYLSFALYPKLLAEKSTEYIMTSLATVLMFAIPMAAGAVALSDSYLTTLNEIYKDATPVLIILAANALVQIISQFFSSVLFGLEKVDEKTKIPLRNLAKSPLFKAFSLPYVHSAIALPTTFYILTNFATDPLSAAVYVSVIDTITRVITFLILLAIMRNMVKLTIPWAKFAKYIFASTVMASFLYFVFVPHPIRLTATLGVTVLGAIIYFLLLTAIDTEARELVHSIWEEIKFRVKG